MSSSKTPIIESHKHKLLNVTDIKQFKISYFDKDWSVRCFDSNDCINKSFFPNDITMALLANASYKEVPKDLPDGWKLIVTAKNEKDGYFGAAFLNCIENHLVIAHRGTEISKLAALLTDIEGIIYNQFTSQLDSASSFVAFVLKRFDLRKVSVSFTGHSLGAWLAQITTFTAKYLTMGDSGFIKNDPIDCEFHPHTVVFDSPGCYEMLIKLSENYYHRYESNAQYLINSLDISIYLSAPNLINTCNRHLGNMYRIYPKLPVWGLKWTGFIQMLTEHPHEAIQYTLLNHNMKNIILALEEGAKKPFQKILDWPLLTWSAGSKSKVSIPGSFLLKAIELFKKVLGLTFERILNLNNDEYKIFFEFANKSNNYIPGNKLTTNVGDIVLHYKVVENPGNECSLSIFNQDELMVLESWFFIKEKSVSPVILESFFAQCGLGNPHKFFKDYMFCVKNGLKIITCDTKETLNSVINRTKLFMSHFPKYKEVVKEQITSVPQLCDALLNAQVKDYLHFNKIDVNEMLFIDTIGIKQFLTSHDSVLFVEACYKNFEPRRIYSILIRLANDQIEFSEESSNFTLLSWSHLLHLDSTVGISFISKQTLAFDVLVLDCEEVCEINERDVNVILKLCEIMFSNESSSKKLIIIANKNEAFERIQTNIKQPYRKCETRGLLWDCLAPDSRMNIMQKHNVIFQNFADKTSLKNILGLEITNPDNMCCLKKIFDNDTLIKLMDCEVLEIGKKPSSLHNLKECFSQVHKYVSKKNLLEFLLTDKPCYALITVVISGIGQSDDDSLKNEIISLLELDTMENTHQQTVKEHIGTLNEMNKKVLIAFNSFDYNDFQLLCPTLSSRIVYWIKFVNGQFILREIYNSNFFIDREFIFPNKIVISHNLRNELIKDDFEDLYIFKNCNVEGLQKTLGISELIEKNILISNNKKGKILCFKLDVEAERIFKEHKTDHRVHMISFEGDELIWEKSDGSLNSVAKHINSEKTRKVSMWTNDFIVNNDQNRPVLIVGDPGMGKSTILWKVSNIISSTNWVFLINLKDCKLAIQNLPKENISAEQVVAFLVEACNLSHISQLERNLLKFKIEFMNGGKQLSLLFDGFDEIKDKIGKSKVIKLLTFLKDKTSIWVTSRNVDAEELQDRLCVLGIKLREFSLVEQKEYLKRFWKARLGLCLDSVILTSCFDIKETNAKSKFDIFFDKLLQNVKENFEERNTKILEIPLQIRFLAEAFENMFSDFVVSDNSCDLNFGEISFLGLFKKFVDLKMSIYIKEKLLLVLGNSVSEEWFKEPSIKRHLRFALFYLFPNDCKPFICEKPPFVVDHSTDNIIVDNKELEELARVGFIHAVKGNLFEFNYQVVAEYFCAEYISKLLNSRTESNKSLLALEFLVGNVLMKREFKSMHLFLNEHLICNRFKKEVLAFYGNHLSILWSNKQGFFINESYQTVFHVISRSNYSNILKFLLCCLIESNKLNNCIDFISIRSLNSETSLYEAAKLSLDGIIDEYYLCLTKACESSIKTVLLATIFRQEHYKKDFLMKKLISQLEKYQELYQVFLEIEKSFPSIEMIFSLIKSSNVNTINKMLLEIPPEILKYLLLVVDSCGNTFLHAASYYSKWDIFQRFLELYSSNDLAYIISLKNEADQSIMQVILNISKIKNMKVIGSLVLNLLLKVPMKNRYPLLTTKNSEGMTILHLGAVDEQWDVVLDLIDCIEDQYQSQILNIKDMRGKRVIHLAAQKGELVILKKFVERGADIIDFSGVSVLHEAVCNPDRTVLPYIIAESKKKLAGDKQNIYSFLNSKDSKGDTPLMWAAERNDIHAVNILLSEPMIDLHINNNKGKTAFDWAKENNNIGVLEVLQFHEKNKTSI